VIKLNKIFLGHQPRQLIKKSLRFQGPSLSPSSELWWSLNCQLFLNNWHRW